MIATVADAVYVTVPVRLGGGLATVASRVLVKENGQARTQVFPVTVDGVASVRVRRPDGAPRRVVLFVAGAQDSYDATTLEVPPDGPVRVVSTTSDPVTQRVMQPAPMMNKVLRLQPTFRLAPRQIQPILLDREEEDDDNGGLWKAGTTVLHGSWSLEVIQAWLFRRSTVMILVAIAATIGLPAMLASMDDDMLEEVTGEKVPELGIPNEVFQTLANCKPKAARPTGNRN